MIELLEARRMMADVTAVRLADDSIRVTGSPGADHLRIFGGVDWDAGIETDGDTTINGDTSWYFGSTTGPVIFDLGDGDDTVEIADAGFWSGEVGVLGGGGNDRVLMPKDGYVANWISHVYFSGGDGDDTLDIAHRAVGDVLFEGNAGRDRAYLNTVVVKGRLNVVDRTGPTGLSAVDVAVARAIRFDTGNSVDRLSLTRVSAKGPLYVNTRGGGDVMYRVYRNRFGATHIDLGDDPNDRYTVLP